MLRGVWLRISPFARRLLRAHWAVLRQRGVTRSEVAVACPFCMIMLEDARGAMGAEELAIPDVAEIVADGLVAG
jgi:Fe-S oxidoreductase